MREKRPRRLTIKKVPKFLSGCMGGRRWLWGQLESTLITWLHLMALQLAVFEDNGLLFWLPDVLCQPTEVVLWSLLSVEMFF